MNRFWQWIGLIGLGTVTVLLLMSARPAASAASGYPYIEQFAGHIRKQVSSGPSLVKCGMRIDWSKCEVKISLAGDHKDPVTGVRVSSCSPPGKLNFRVQHQSGYWSEFQLTLKGPQAGGPWKDSKGVSGRFSGLRNLKEKARGTSGRSRPPAGKPATGDSDPFAGARASSGGGTSTAGGAAATRPTAASFAGTWRTDWGMMKLRQSGNRVEGTYSHQNGRITGTVSGNTLTGYWSQNPSHEFPNDKGPLSLTLTDGGRKFTGTWQRVKERTRGTPGGTWNGTRVAEAGQAATATDPDAALNQLFQKQIREARQLFEERADSPPRTTIEAVNPKQASLDRVWQAAQTARRFRDPAQQADRLITAAREQIGFGARMFAFTSKTDFINSAATILNLTPGPIGRVAAKRTRAGLYLKLGKAWRELTRIALLGDHQWNKMACDAQTKRWLALAVQTDPDSTAAVRERENAGRFQAVQTRPPSFDRYEPIPEQRWALTGEIQRMLTQRGLRAAMMRASSPRYAPSNWRRERYKHETYVGGGHGRTEPMGGQEARLTEISGRVSLNGHAVSGTTELSSGDIITTGADGRAVIRYDDGTFMNIKPEAEVGWQPYNITVKRGGLFLNITKKKQRLMIITPTALTGCFGTVLETWVDARGQTGVLLHQGAVEVRNGTSVAWLENGQRTEALTGGNTMEVGRFDPAQRLARLWPGVDARQAAHRPGPDNSGGAATETVLVEDDFNGPDIKGRIWEQWTATGKGSGFGSGRGTGISLANGRLTISQAKTDRGGALVSVPIQPLPGSQLVIAKRTRIHSANTHFSGRTFITTEDGRGLYGRVYYAKYKDINAFVAGDFYKGVRSAPIWDQWFTEVIIWDPASGEMAWIINDRQPVVFKGAPAKGRFRIAMSAYGWHTGHRQELDGIKIFWTGGNGATAEPDPHHQQPAADHHPAGVVMGWSPDGRFFPITSGAQIGYGQVALTARLSTSPVNHDRPVTVVWLLNGSQRIFQANYLLKAGQNSLDSYIALQREAINPGLYRAVFTSNGRQLAAGELTVTPPPSGQGHSPDQVYLAGLRQLQAAAGAINNDDGLQGGKLAGEAAVLLATAMRAQPGLPDVTASLQFALALEAMGRLVRAAEQNNAAQALEWALNCRGYAANAANWSGDAGLKNMAANLLAGVEQMLPGLAQEAGR